MLHIIASTSVLCVAGAWLRRAFAAESNMFLIKVYNDTDVVSINVLTEIEPIAILGVLIPLLVQRVLYKSITVVFLVLYFNFKSDGLVVSLAPSGL